MVSTRTLLSNPEDWTHKGARVLAPESCCVNLRGECRRHEEASGGSWVVSCERWRADTQRGSAVAPGSCCVSLRGECRTHEGASRGSRVVSCERWTAVG
ncbi:hypothetical protein CRG98_018651 [Punica granatum]|uniref:Uncharacterized protein n=1 Tax=Punica granatum TaxID=22663 RepID=A0A2I0JXC9_PUNGR|nr:hypothetical protein CRG98_018651 [Punica granatum]